ncbi:MAG: hypothetical protein ACUVQ1_04900 [Candidatus Kapaibacteriales bacterium]
MTEKKDIFAQIIEDDLTNDLLIIANSCGIEVAGDLLRNCAGITIYVPKVSHLEKFISRYIRENLDKNFKIIAPELGVSEQHIRNIFRNNR